MLWGQHHARHGMCTLCPFCKCLFTLGRGLLGTGVPLHEALFASPWFPGLSSSPDESWPTDTSGLPQALSRGPGQAPGPGLSRPCRSSCSTSRGSDSCFSVGTRSQAPLLFPPGVLGPSTRTVGHLCRAWLPRPALSPRPAQPSATTCLTCGPGGAGFLWLQGCGGSEVRKHESAPLLSLWPSGPRASPWISEQFSVSVRRC